MVKQEDSRTIRISQEVYDYIDTRADRASETFDEILRRLLKVPSVNQKRTKFNGGNNGKD